MTDERREKGTRRSDEERHGKSNRSELVTHIPSVVLSVHLGSFHSLPSHLRPSGRVADETGGE